MLIIINIKYYLIGWGRTENRTRTVANWLQKGNVKEVSHEECYESYKANNISKSLPKGIDDSSQICAIGTKTDGNTIDSCAGLRQNNWLTFKYFIYKIRYR